MSALELGIDFQMPKNQSSQIKVMGIGGGGSNAVNYMYENGIKGVDFVICNTDAQALEAAPVPIKIQLGINLTEGLGAGSNPDVGKRAAEESADRITELLDANTKMLFITAGMGGGTGTGAAPVIAEIAKEKQILTVGVVTVPFATEGGYRRKYADEGITELKKYVDTLLVIDNERLIEVYGDLTFTAAFAKANEVLNTATKGIAEVISQHLLVNIDLNDARKVLENSGTAVMGQAKVEGENRAIEAVIEALDSPLLNDNDITGAQQVLLKIVTGDGEGEIKMSELAKIKNKIQEAAGRNVNIIEGIGIDTELGMAISVTVIATGFEERRKPKGPTTVKLDEDNFDAIISNEAVKEKESSESNTTNNIQQTLMLNDDIEYKKSFEMKENILENSDEEEIVSENDSNSELKESVLENTNEEVIVSENDSKKIVFDLENDFCEKSSEEKEESSSEMISSIILEDKIEEKQILDSDQLNKSSEESVLNKSDSTKSTSEVMKIESREREERLRNISIQLRTPSGLTSLEDVPAYKRNNVDISKQIHSSESEASIYTLTNGDDNTTELKQNNSFLHDNVD
ncbi:MAG: cell division protein FtsZ [Flavobacteriales bacterium]|nr:cell division protein FtsZ [Flavobacteriales bacterium]|tara:strand:- start:1393 stop:3117 length:1725 start_codon:yes stop_codon:yes gene_type:complete